jgi:hypothetical protein
MQGQAGYWHHDRCGARLKAYVLLSDVDVDTHPMQIAKGSHRTLFFRYHRAVCTTHVSCHIQLLQQFPVTQRELTLESHSIGGQLKQPEQPIMPGQ